MILLSLVVSAQQQLANQAIAPLLNISVPRLARGKPIQSFIHSAADPPAFGAGRFSPPADVAAGQPDRGRGIHRLLTLLQLGLRVMWLRYKMRGIVDLVQG